MKKFLALLLSVLMLLTVTASFAEDAVAPSTTEARFTKKYTGAIPVGDTLTFKTEFVINKTTGSTVAPEKAILPDTITLNVTDDADGVFDVPFTVTAPDEYGTYIYKITEDTTNANSYVKYDTEALYIGVLYTASKLTVTLINEPKAAAPADFDVEDRAADVEPEENPDGKKDQFVNEYKMGAFSVTKEITGNAANLTDKFVVEVSFTSEKALDNLAMTWTSSTNTGVVNACPVTELKANEAATMQITIGHEETISFQNVPQGVTVKIVEKQQDGKGEGNLNFYTPAYTNQEITVGETAQVMEIVNTKETEIPTGVQLDSIPYIVLLAVAVLGVVGFVVKRRMAAADEE